MLNTPFVTYYKSSIVKTRFLRKHVINVSKTYIFFNITVIYDESNKRKKNIIRAFISQYKIKLE